MSGRDRSSWMSPVPELEGSIFLAELGFSGAVGQRGHLRMGQWMLRGVTSSPCVPSSTSGVDPAAVPGVRMGRNRPSRNHLTHAGSG